LPTAETCKVSPSSLRKESSVNSTAANIKERARPKLTPISSAPHRKFSELFCVLITTLGGNKEKGGFSSSADVRTLAADVLTVAADANGQTSGKEEEEGRGEKWGQTEVERVRRGEGRGRLAAVRNGFEKSTYEGGKRGPWAGY